MATSVKSVKKRAKDSPFTMELNDDEREKLSALQGYCIANGVPASGGTVMRTLLMNIPDNDVSFLGMAKRQAAIEKERSVAIRRKNRAG